MAYHTLRDFSCCIVDLHIAIQIDLGLFDRVRDSSMLLKHEMWDNTNAEQGQHGCDAAGHARDGDEGGAVIDPYLHVHRLQLGVGVAHAAQHLQRAVQQAVQHKHRLCFGRDNVLLVHDPRAGGGRDQVRMCRARLLIPAGAAPQAGPLRGHDWDHSYLVSRLLIGAIQVCS